MGSNQRNEILTTLKQDLWDSVQYSSGYDSDIAQVERGAHLPDLVSNFPFVCFLATNDSMIQQMMGTKQQRRLFIDLYGYSRTTETDYTNIYNLLSSLEQFLESSQWTHFRNTLVGDVEIWESGSSDEISAIKLSITIDYIKEH